jgi:hypothetical protein
VTSTTVTSTTVAFRPGMGSLTTSIVAAVRSALAHGLEGVDVLRSPCRPTLAASGTRIVVPASSACPGAAPSPRHVLWAQAFPGRLAGALSPPSTSAGARVSGTRELVGGTEQTHHLL